VTGIDAAGSLEAVVFDLDGVLVDSEEIWDEARRKLALERGLAWPASAQRDMMGMSSLEWSRYMHERVGLTEAPEEISAEVVSRLEGLYWQHLPLMEGAVQAVGRMAKRFRLGLASSSNRPRAGARRRRRLLRGQRLVRGGRARQARAGRLP
jgi:beta-phosphoglucomutase-like phosphatase (HAD superfamily)